MLVMNGNNDFYHCLPLQPLQTDVRLNAKEPQSQYLCGSQNINPIKTLYHCIVITIVSTIGLPLLTIQKAMVTMVTMVTMVEIVVTIHA